MGAHLYVSCPQDFCIITKCTHTHTHTHTGPGWCHKPQWMMNMLRNRHIKLCLCSHQICWYHNAIHSDTQCIVIPWGTVFGVNATSHSFVFRYCNTDDNAYHHYLICRIIYCQLGHSCHDCTLYQILFSWLHSFQSSDVWCVIHIWNTTVLLTSVACTCMLRYFFLNKVDWPHYSIQVYC